MLNSKEDTILGAEVMPAALLAGMFSTGIVVLPEEFKEVKKQAMTTQVPAAKEVAKKSPKDVVKELDTDVARVEIAIVQEPDVPLVWLGNFQKKVLVVVQDTTARHLNDVDYGFLTKILEAVNLSIADTAIVNAAAHPLEYYALQEKLPAAVAFYFGIAPADIGAPIRFPHFQVQKWNQTTFLFSPPLSQLNGTDAEAITLKKNLWASLKRIFD